MSQLESTSYVKKTGKSLKWYDMSKRQLGEGKLTILVFLLPLKATQSIANIAQNAYKCVV